MYVFLMLSGCRERERVREREGENDRDRDSAVDVVN